MKLLGSLRDSAYDAFVREYQKPPENEALLVRWAVERGMLKPPSAAPGEGVKPRVTWNDQGQPERDEEEPTE